MEENSSANGWVTLAEGGLPRLVAGAAGDAVSRLVGSLVNIPVAVLDSVAQRVKDEVEARSVMTKALSDAAAQMATSDPALVQRAMETMLSRQIRAQKNRDAIAVSLIRDLMEDPPSQDSPGPSSEWLDVFETLADDASSENLQNLFSRVLAGEIRRPGSISQMTLRVASFLDEELAKQIELAASRATPDGWVLDDRQFTDPRPDYRALSEIGFMENPSIVPSWGQATDSAGRLMLDFGTDKIIATYCERKGDIILDVPRAAAV